MKGTKARIWRALSIFTVLALMIGLLPAASTALAAPGDTRLQAIELALNTPASGTSTPPNGRWFSLDFSGTQTVNIELQGDPILMMNVYRGINNHFEAGGGFVRFFTLNPSPANSGKYFFEVIGGATPGIPFTLTARTSGGGGGGSMGDSRFNPEPLNAPLPVVRAVVAPVVPSKWFSRTFGGDVDIDVTVSTPDPNVQLWVYYGSSPSPLTQSTGGKKFRLSRGSPTGEYFFEVRNVQGVNFDINLSQPMAAGACSTKLSACPVGSNSPFYGSVGQDGSMWLRFDHPGGQRASVELHTPAASVFLNVFQGDAGVPLASNTRNFPLGDMPGTWSFQVTGGYQGGSFDVTVSTSASGGALPPGGGPDRYSAVPVGVGDIRMGQLLAGGGTWYRFGFFGEPAKITLTTDTGGPDSLSVYYNYSTAAVFNPPIPQPTMAFTLTSSGDYFINVANPSAGPSDYTLKIEGVGSGSSSPGSSQSSAIPLPVASAGTPSLTVGTFAGDKLWFSYNYNVPFQPNEIRMENALGLVFDVFFGLSPAPIGTSRSLDASAGPSSTQGFTISSPNIGLYYIAVRPMGYMPPGANIPITMRASAQAGPSGGMPLGDRYNPQRIDSDLEVRSYLSPQQNYWYSYDIPSGKKVEISLVQADRGVALNIYGFDPTPIAPGVRSWTAPPFFGQPNVFINVAAPNGGNYVLKASTATAAAGDGSTRQGAIPLPSEMDVSGTLSPSGVQRIWYVFQHSGSTVTFKLKNPSDPTAPLGSAKMDIFTGDSNFPQPGSGSNSGFLGGGVPPGPVFIMVSYAPMSSGIVPFLIQATTQVDFGTPGGGPGMGFNQPSTSIKAEVRDCDTNPPALVPKGRVAVIYNGQTIATTMVPTGILDLSPSSLPNGGKDGHYDLRGLPPAAGAVADGDPGTNCAPGYRIGFDLNGGLVFPAGPHTLMLERAQLVGTVKDSSGTVIAKARVKAVPDYGSAAAGMGMPGGSGGSNTFAAVGFGGRGGEDDAVMVKTNGQGVYKMGGFMPGIPYNIVAYPPEPDDSGPGALTQSQPSKMRFSGVGFSFGGTFDPNGGFRADPGAGGYGAPGGYGGYGGYGDPGGYGGYGGYGAPGGYGGYGGYGAPGGYGGYGGYGAPGGYGGYGGFQAGTAIRSLADVQTLPLTLTAASLVGQVRNPAGGTVGTAGSTAGSSRVVAEEEFSGGFGPTMGPQSSSVVIEGYTDANGNYRLGALATGKTYKIVAEAPTSGANAVYKTSQPRRVSYNGTQLTDINLSLTSAQITVAVTSGGVGIPGARVELFNMGSFGPGVFYQEETNSDGVATFGGLADGMYNISAFPPPDPSYFNLAPSAPQQTKITSGVASPGSINFNLGAATLTGMVYKSDGTTPATGGVSVEIFKTDYTFHYGVGVNMQGAFAAGGMPAGAYKVQAKVHGNFGFGEQSQDSDSVARDVTIDSSGNPDASWDGRLVLTEPQVTIFVVDPDGNAPRYPVHISEVGDAGQPIGDGTETDPATGRALLGGLAAGNYSIGVFLPPMLPYAAPDAQSVTVASGGDATPSTITFQLVAPKKKITGTIKKANGTAVSNAGVHAFREDGSGNADAFANSDGSYTLKLAKGGTWLLVLFPMFGGQGGAETKMQQGRSIKDLSAELDWIFTEAPRRVEFAQSDSVEETISGVNFTVARAGATVTGRVQMETGGSAPNTGSTFVDVRDESGIGNGVPLSEDGTFTVAVPAGITARVRVFSKDQSLSQKGEPPLVEPKEGTPVDVGTVYLTQLALSISGQVVISGATDANGDPIGVESVEVTAFKEGGLGFARTTTTTGGVFTLAVSNGDWRVTARPGKGSRYTPKGRPAQVEVQDESVSDVSLEVQAADGEITANLSWAAGVTPPFAISQLFGFGIALEQPGNSLAAGTSMERGSFKLRVPSGKSYTVSVDFPPGLAFGADPQTVNLTSVTTATVQIPVSVANATVIGEWVDSSGARVQGLDAEAFASGPKGFKSTALSATGRYNLSLIAGTWFVGGKVKSSGYAVIPPANNQVTAVSGDIVDGPTFTVVQANGQIAGTVKNPSGAGLVARVWAETKPASATEAPRLVADAVSASDGTYTMNAPAGTYIVRAAVPPEKGYLPPLPVQAVVPTTGVVTVDFQFRASEANISGNVAGPGAATALVTAYSDKGAWASTMVTTTGQVSYTLGATTNDVWHIVASSSYSSTVYRSDPVTITVSSVSVTGQDLELKPVPALTLPSGSSVTFDSTSMQVLALEDGTQVTIPSGALATSGDVTVYVIPTEKLTSQPSAQSRLIGYNLKAFDSNNVEIKKFKQEVTLRVPYPDDATLAAMGIEESKLKPMYYDTTSGSWVVSEPYTQDTVNNVFIITTDHFTIFAGILTAGAQTVGTSIIKIYVPFIHRVFEPGW